MAPPEDGRPHRLPERDRPWMMRTYAGHSSAAATNALIDSTIDTLRQHIGAQQAARA